MVVTVYIDFGKTVVNLPWQRFVHGSVWLAGRVGAQFFIKFPRSDLQKHRLSRVQTIGMLNDYFYKLHLMQNIKHAQNVQNAQIVWVNWLPGLVLYCRVGRVCGGSLHPSFKNSDGSGPQELTPWTTLPYSWRQRETPQSSIINYDHRGCQYSNKLYNNHHLKFIG